MRSSRPGCRKALYRANTRDPSLANGNGSGATGLGFTICEPDTLEYRATGRPDHRSAPLNPAAFARLLPGFTIKDSVVLRHGFQEYVAVRLEDLNEEAPDEKK